MGTKGLVGSLRWIGRCLTWFSIRGPLFGVNGILSPAAKLWYTTCGEPTMDGGPSPLIRSCEAGKELAMAAITGEFLLLD